MRNSKKNAWQSLLHNRRHLVFAIYRRLPWLIPNDKLYLRIYYRLSLRKKLNLDNPKEYNEKLQWLKLYNRKPEYVQMVDKLLVKDYVSKIIGKKYVIPTIGMWNSLKEIDWDSLPNQFVLKTNHDGGGNGIVVCKNKETLNRKKALRELNHSFNRNVYLIGREWPYKKVKRVVFAEQYMEDEKTKELRDYKFFCFDGEVKALYVATGRSQYEKARFDFFDENFNHLPITQGHPLSDKPIEKPESFEVMKQLASELSVGIPHVRVDFYEVNGHPYFGEFTFFHLGGTGNFQPEQWNRIFGDWITLPDRNE